MARRGENIYKRKDGRWEGRYQAGYREDGKPKYRSVYGKNYQAVKEKLASIKVCNSVTYEKPGSLTVKELFDEWLTAVRLKVKPSTYANYQMKAKKHILPAFGGMRFAQLSVKMIHEFIQSKLDSGLSAKYVSDIVVVFKSMAKYVSAVHHFQNPIINAVLPKSTKREMHLFSEEQQKTLCRYLMKNRNATSLCVMLSLYTGLRIGEVCALRWSDLGDDGTITVSHALGNADGGFYEKEPKTSSSRRTIPLTAHTFQQLTAMRAESRRHMAEFGLAGDPYILGTQEPDSRPYNPTQLGKDFAAFCKMNGFSCTFHAWSVKQTRQWRVCSDKARASSPRTPWPCSRPPRPSRSVRHKAST